MRIIIFLFGLVFFTGSAFSAATRTVTADQIQSSDLTKTWGLPSTSGTLLNENSGWITTGNAGTSPGTNFLGTTDNQDLQFKTNNNLRMTVKNTGDIEALQTTDIFLNTNTTKYKYQCLVNPTASQANSTTHVMEINGAYDQANTGFNTSNFSTLYNRWEHDGSGTIGFGSVFDGSIYFNGGGGTTTLFKGLNIDASVNAGSNINSYYGISNSATINSAAIGNWQNANYSVTASDSSFNSLTGLNVNPQVSGSSTISQSLSGVASYPAASGAAAISSNVIAYDGQATLNNTANANTVNAANLRVSLNNSSQATNLTGEAVNVSVNNTASVTNAIKGIDVLMTTTPAVSGVIGLTSDVSGVNAPNDQKSALVTSGGLTNLGYVTALDAGDTFWQTHYIGGGLNVVNGSPISTYGFGINAAQIVDFQDNWNADFTGLHLGFSSIGAVGSISGAVGKTMDAWTGILAGAGNASGAGTVTYATMFRAAGFLPQGGSISATNMRGFSIASTLCATAVNCWGVFDDGSGAENYLQKLALGTSGSGKVSNSDIALEIQGQKGIVNGRGTTAQKLALTAIAGMQFYDTSLNKLQWYNGSAWIDASGGAGSVTAVTASAPLSSSGGTTPNISITQSSSTTDGYLSSTDWNTFNNKFTLPSLTNGSVIFSNGTTLAQNNANFFWDNVNTRLGIGTNTPSATFDIHHPSGISAQFTATGGQSVNGGAQIATYADPGAAINSGSRLGFFGMGGAYNGSSNLYESSAIASYATQNWSAPNRGSKLVFQTTPNGSNSIADAMTIDQDKTVTMNAYGAGIAHFSAGGLISSSAVNLTSDVSGVLPIANGGTGSSSIPTSGQIPIGTGSIYSPQTVSGEATISSIGAVTLNNGAVTGKLLTGFVSGAGSVSATDSILGAIQKLDGNIAGKQPAGSYLVTTNNLSDLTNTTTARANLGLGSVATKAAPTGTSAQLLANDGSSGFSNVTIDASLNYSGGTLSAPGKDFVQDVFVCNGGAAFTLTNTPYQSSNINAHIDGTALIQGASYDYTISGTTLNLNSACATGQKLQVIYAK